MVQVTIWPKNASDVADRAPCVLDERIRCPLSVEDLIGVDLHESSKDLFEFLLPETFEEVALCRVDRHTRRLFDDAASVLGRRLGLEDEMGDFVLEIDEGHHVFLYD